MTDPNRPMIRYQSELAKQLEQHRATREQTQANVAALLDRQAGERAASQSPPPGSVKQ